MSWWELLLFVIGAFGFGWGLAERQNRKNLRELDMLLLMLLGRKK